jgi:hypothetical protein
VSANVALFPSHNTSTYLKDLGFELSIEKCSCWTEWPRTAVRTIEEAAVGCWENDGHVAQLARAPAKKAGGRSHKKSIKIIWLHVGV